MYRHRPLSRPQLQPSQHASLPQTRKADRLPIAKAGTRQGRAITEVLLIVLVPCLCLFVWSLFDVSIKKGLLAGPNSDSFAATNPVFGVVPADDGVVIAIHSRGQLKFWNTAQSEVLGEIQSDLDELRCGAYSSQQRLLVIGSAMGWLETWDLDRPDRPVSSIVAREHEITKCRFTPDGSLLIMGDEGGFLSFWEPRTLRLVQVVKSSNEEHSIRSLQISPDGKYLLAGTRSGFVEVWDVVERKLIRTIQVAQTQVRPDLYIEAVEFLHGKNEFVAATHSDGISVWNYDSGVCVRRFSEPLQGIRSGALSVDGTCFVSGADRGQIRIWDVSTGLPLKSLTQSPSIVRSLAWYPGGRLVVAGNCAGDVNLHPY